MLVNQPYEQKKFQIQPNEQESKCLGFKDEQTLRLILLFNISLIDYC